MSNVSTWPLNLQSGIKSRSLGVKLIVVCILALIMMIPALFVGSLVEDRTKRAADVIKEISSHIGGQQTFLGPTLAIPYSIPPRSQLDAAKHGMYLVFPTRASAVLKVASEERRRSRYGDPAFDECGMDILKPIAGDQSPSYLHLAIHAHLYAATP